MFTKMYKVTVQQLVLHTRWLLRFEFQLPHPILSPALATDKKWVNFISLTKTQKSADQKCRFLTFKVNFLCQKLSETFQKIFSLKNIILGVHFLFLTFFQKFNFLSTLFTKIRPMKWLKGHFLSVAKVVHKIGCGSWYSNLKRHLLCT